MSSRSRRRSRALFCWCCSAAVFAAVASVVAGHIRPTMASPPSHHQAEVTISMAEADPSGSSPPVADRCADLIVRLGSISAAAAGPPEPDSRLRTELADLERQVPPEVSRALDTWVMALSADEATDAATEAVIDEWFDRVCPGR